MKLIKWSAILLAITISLGGSYLYYCYWFWGDYYENQLSDNYLNYSFEIVNATGVPEIITYDNFKNYEWKRQVLEPNHGLWINNVGLYFTSDSTFSASIQACYINDNYWTYPLFEVLRNCDSYSSDYIFDRDSHFYIEIIEGVKEFEYPIFLKIIDNKLVIHDYFL